MTHLRAARFAGQALATPCPECHTLGLVKDSSIKTGMQLLPCEKCGGSGFIGRREPAAPEPLPELTS